MHSISQPSAYGPATSLLCSLVPFCFAALIKPRCGALSPASGKQYNYQIPVGRAQSRTLTKDFKKTQDNRYFHPSGDKILTQSWSIWWWPWISASSIFNHFPKERRKTLAALRSFPTFPERHREKGGLHVSGSRPGKLAGSLLWARYSKIQIILPPEKIPEYDNLQLVILALISPSLNHDLSTVLY